MHFKEFLQKRQVPFEIVPHPATHSSSRLAQSTHTRGNAVGKTVLLHANHGFVDVVVVVPSTCQVDVVKVSEVLGGAQVELASQDDISRHCPDCERGVLPPFGSQYAMQTIVDESLIDREQILFEGETHDEAIRMRFEDFRRVENPLVGSIVVRK
jgi:Ala-tRNA(Pro) deacylase